MRCDKRISDCGPKDTIAFADSKADVVATFMGTGEARAYRVVLDQTDALIDGFQSPLGMELLATVDWLLRRKGCAAEVSALHCALARWPGGKDAGARKTRIFNERLLRLALVVV